MLDAYDHIEEVERSMRVVKERIRGLVQGFLLRRMPSLIVVWLVEVAARNLNTFPV